MHFKYVKYYIIRSLNNFWNVSAISPTYKVNTKQSPMFMQ